MAFILAICHFTHAHSLSADPELPHFTPSFHTCIHPLPTDYLRLLKYGDSLYRCKELKRAAMVSRGEPSLPLM